MNIIIDGHEATAIYGESLLETARRAGIHIPTLCFHEAFPGQGRCRMCMVEVRQEGRKNVVAACTYPVKGPVEVLTSTPVIEKIRRHVVMLLYKRASGSAQLQKLYTEYGCENSTLSENPGERCILCNLCVLACDELGISALALIMRGIDKQASTPYNMAAEACIGCGTCARICPTDAIDMTEDAGIRSIWHQKFPLAACEQCGKYYATRAEIEYLESRNPSFASPGNICEDCRKRMTTRKVLAFISEDN